MPNFQIKEHTLPNGLRTVMLPLASGETVTFLVLIGVGSRFETPKQAGLSHFLEHMFFKGTERRPSTSDIAVALDELGADYNAFTAEEYTGFYVKVASQLLERGADVITDILLRPLFAAEEIDRERGVIKEEIKMYTDMPSHHVWHLWNRAMYGEHPLGRRIDGLPETVDAFQRQDFLDYTKRHYHCGNAIVAVAGNFDPDKTEALLAKLLGSFPDGGTAEAVAAPVKMPERRFIGEQRASLDQTHLIVGVPGVSLKAASRWAIEVLSVVLGGGMSSRLFLTVRERHGLAYSIRTSTQMLTDNGLVATQAGVRTEALDQALKLTLAEMDRLRQEPISETELTKAKQMIRGHALIELEETNALAAFAGTQALLEKTMETPEERLAKIDAVSVADVQGAAQKIFDPKQITAAVLGPQASWSSIQAILGV